MHMHTEKKLKVTKFTELLSNDKMFTTTLTGLCVYYMCTQLSYLSFCLLINLSSQQVGTQTSKRFKVRTELVANEVWKAK